MKRKGTKGTLFSLLVVGTFVAWLPGAESSRSSTAVLPASVVTAQGSQEPQAMVSSSPWLCPTYFDFLLKNFF